MKTVLFFICLFIFKANIISCKIISENKDTLSFIRSFTINEDSLIIQNINNISFSPNKKFYLISSRQTQELPIFYKNSDLLYKIIKANKDLSDSAVYHLKLLKKQYSNYNLYTKKEVEETLGSSPLLNMMNETFEYSGFIDDSTIIILCNIDFARTVETEDLQTARSRVVSHCCAVLFYNINTDKRRFIILQNEFLEFKKKILTYLQPVKFSIDNRNKCFYIPSRSSFYITDTLNLDIYSTASKIDFSGKFIENISFLPDEYLNSGIKYLYDYKPNLACDGKNLALQYSILPFFILNGKKIMMSGFNSDNAQMLDSLKQLPSKNNDFMSFSNIIRRNQPFHNASIYILKNDIIMTSTLVKNKINDSNEYFPIIQFYDFKGKLLNTYFPEKINKNGKFKFLSYNKYTNEILLLRKNDNKWEVEVYENKF
jgi:hypothetical protein